MNADMLVLYYLLLLGVTFLLFLPLIWNSNLRRFLAGGLVIYSGFITGCALFLAPNSLFVPLAFMQLYAMFNLFRIVEDRMNGHYMYRATARTAIMVTGIQLLYAAAWWVLTSLDNVAVLAGVLVLQFLYVATVLYIAQKRIKQSAFQYLGDDQHNATPTVTVAIPARNESQDLDECLQSLLKTNYSKLEILVLDDCSQGRRTSEIIRDFAHDGVRFIQGEPVRDYWLAKNQAYDALADRASGDIVLFCGVDTRFEPQTIQRLVNQLVISKQRMFSCLPLRHNDRVTAWAPAQFNRYVHELVFPSFILGRPPVLSTCFMIYRADIDKFGGFDAVRRAVNPEGYFAKQLNKQGLYSFLRPTANIGLYSVKSSYGQRNTALRTLYPQLRKRPESVLFFTIATAYGVYGPVVLFVLAIAGIVPFVVGVVAVAIELLWLLHYFQIIRATGIHKSRQAMLYAPCIALYDIVLLHVSMIKYEFSEVMWKGRNICEPVMHVLPHLPSLDEERKS